MGSGSGSGSGNSWNSNRWNNHQPAAAGSGSGSGGGFAARSGSGSGSGSGGGNWGGGNSGGHAGGSGSGSGGGGHAGGSGSGSGSGGGGHAGGSGSGSGGGGHAGGSGSGSGSGGGGHAGGSGSGSGSGGGGHAGGSGSGSGSGGGGHAGGSGSGSGSGGGNSGGSGSGSASGGGGGGGNQNGWITGRMFNDTNTDGLETNAQGGTEQGVQGARVELLDTHGNVVQVSYTNATGDYTFDVPAGAYRVHFPDLPGRDFTTQNAGGNDAIDSDANAQGLTDLIHVSGGSTIRDVDAGVIPEAPTDAKIAGRLFNDANFSDRDENEAGFEGKAVALYDPSTSKIVAWTTTDSEGKYSFTAAPGEYQVMFRVDDLAKDHTIAAPNVGDDINDSDGESIYEYGINSVGQYAAEVYTGRFTVNAGDQLHDVDVGLQLKPGTISGRMTLDDDRDNTEVNTVTDDNNDGLDRGIANQTVELLDSNGNVVASTTTDANGNYSFTADPGDYQVRFAEPDDQDFATQNVGDEATDSDANASGVTETITLTAGGTVSNVDASLVSALGALEGRMFIDADKDGLDNLGPIGTDALTLNSGTLTSDGVPGGMTAVEFNGGHAAGASTGASTVGGDMSISAWARFDSTNGHYQRVFDISNGAQSDNILLSQVAGTDDMLFEVYHGGGQPNTKIFVRDTIEEGKWAHWTVTATDDGTYKLYKDGTEVGSATGQPAISEIHRANTLLGDSPWSGDTTLDGAVAGMNVYDRVLTPQEIAKLAANPGDGVEAGQAGATVTLLNADGTPVLDDAGQPVTTTTDAHGDYRFDGLEAGDYRVQFELPNGRVFTTQNVGQSEAIDSDVNASGVSDVATVRAGETTSNVDAGIHDQPKGTISGRMTLDDDRDDTETNTVQDDNNDALDRGIANQRVELLDTHGNVVAHTTTDAQGNYSFTADPGDYQVRFAEPAGHDFADQNVGAEAVDSDANASGVTETITLAAGATVSDVDASLQVTQGTISGRMTLDDDRDNTETNTDTSDNSDALDRGIANQRVELLDTHGNVVAHTTTDAQGNYSFTADPGDYQVRFAEPDDHDFATQNVGAETVDSDANASGVTETITLTAGGSVSDVDASLVTELGSIEGRVFIDADHNDVDGSYTAGGDQVVAHENFNGGASGWSNNQTGRSGNGDTYLGNHGAASGQVTSKTFDLPDGTNSVKVEFDLLEIDSWDGESFSVFVNDTKVDIGPFFVDSAYGDRDNHISGTVDAGNGTQVSFNSSSIGGGLGHRGGVGSFWNDESHKITLTITNPGDDLKLGFGSTLNGRFGDEGWGVDNLSVTATTPAMHTAEAGQGNVQVALLNPDGSAVLDAAGQPVTTTTDANGAYNFDDVIPGDYRVQFTAPDGRVFVGQDVGSDDRIDSDVNGSGLSGVVSVAPGQHVADLDAGIKDTPQGTISGRMTLDDDRDNTEANTVTDDNADALDRGIANQTVELLDTSGNVVASTTTDANGNYSFSVAPGDYQVRFAEPAGHDFAAQNVGAEDVDSDANASGVTETITVTSGGSVQNVDASLVTELGRIQGRVSLDDDRDNLETNTVQNDNADALDTGLGGQTVYLVDDQGNEVASTTTDANGNYGFDVAPGDYQVRFEVGDNQQLAQANVGSDDTIDSDAGGRGGVTETISVSAGQTVSDVDASMQLLQGQISGRLSLDDDADNTELNTVTDDNSDALDSGLGNQTVQLLDTSGNVVASTTTDAGGNYSFDVDPGQYQVRFPTLDDHRFATQNVGSDATDSDAGANGVTDVITVGASQMVSNVDASLQPLIGRVEGRVSLDDDFDQTEANTDTDDNNNPLDEGVRGVTVELLNDNGDVVATTTTDANGAYGFDVAAGTYQVRFEGVDDHVFAQQDVGGDDAIDSDASARGLTDQFTVQGGKTTANVDASVQQNIGYIEGRVTLDDDEDNTETNSVQDDNSDPLDQGIANQTVYLLDDQGNEVATTTTDATGAYAFAVAPGDYQVRFEAGDNQRFADQNVGGNEAVDSDANGRGLTDPISVGVGQTVDNVDASLIDEKPVVGTATVKGRVFRDDNHDSLDNGEDGIGDIDVALYAADGTLVATTTTEGDGSYKFENVVAGDYYVDFNENDPDAGGRVLVTKDVDGNVSDNIDSDADQATGVTDVFSVADGQFIFNKDAGFEDPSKSSISGRYFEDSDFDGVDNGEDGLAGYHVQLLAEDGSVLRTTTTDANGDYTFDKIDGGRYQVKFLKDDSDPREFTFRNANGDDGDDTTDSDVDDNGVSPFIQVGINQHVTDVDAGLLPDPDGGIDGGPDFEDPLDGMMNQDPDDLDRGLNEEEEEDELDPMLG